MITNIVLIAFALIVIGVCILKNVRRSVTRSVAGLVSTVIAAIAACFIAKWIASSLGGTFLKLFINAISQSSSGVPEGIVNIGSAIVASIAAPLVFIPVVLILNVILALLSKPLCTLLEKKSEVMNKKNAIAAVALGVLAGVLVCVIYITPVAGYAAMASTILPEGEEADDPSSLRVDGALLADVATDIGAIFRDLANSFIAQGTLEIGGKVLFSELTTAETEELRICLYEEIETISMVADCLTLLTSKSVADYGDEEMAMLDTLCETLKGDSAIGTIVAEVLSSAAESWQQGESFLGIENPLPADNSVINTEALLSNMVNYDKETLANDISSANNAIKVIVENDLLSGGDEGAALENLFSPEMIESEHFEDILRELLASNSISDGVIATIRQKLDEVLKESEEAGANASLCDSIDAYADSLGANDLAKLVADILPVIKSAEGGATSDELKAKITPVFTYVADNENGNLMLKEVLTAGLKLQWIRDEIGVSSGEADNIIAGMTGKVDIELCVNIASRALTKLPH